jgi:RNA polymerase sigma-70 factor (ECF subfamily)
MDPIPQITPQAQDIRLPAAPPVLSSADTPSVAEITAPKATSAIVDAARREEGMKILTDHLDYIRDTLSKRSKLSPHDQDDIYQNIVLVLARRAEHLVEINNVPHYLGRTIKNAVINHYKRNVGRTVSFAGESEQQVSDKGPSTLEALMVEDNIRKMREALPKLSPLQREILTELYLSGLNHAQAAEKLGIPVGTVKSRLNKALKNLHELMRSPADDDAAPAHEDAE